MRTVFAAALIAASPAVGNTDPIEKIAHAAERASETCQTGENRTDRHHAYLRLLSIVPVALSMANDDPTKLPTAEYVVDLMSACFAADR